MPKLLQRIQTIFWLLGAISVALLFLFPLAQLSGNEEIAFWMNGFMADGADQYLRPTWPLGALGSIIIVISLATIFLYKRRVLQIRLTTYTIILLVALIGLGLFYLLTAKTDFSATLTPGYISILPVVAIVFNILAWRGVRRDYLMLKAVDRIR